MTSVQQIYDYLLVLDFEATCEDKATDPGWKNEVIEFPIVAVEVKTGTIVAEFREYVRPSLNTKLTHYCTNLTGIEQDTVDAADDFRSVFVRVLDWYAKFQADHPESSSIFLTCGDWDLRRMLPEQLKLTPIDGEVDISCFEKWINVKTPFKQLMGNCKELGGVGMDTMLESLGLPLIGRHHSGLDDARNIAAIACELMRRGVVLRQTWPVTKKDEV